MPYVQAIELIQDERDQLNIRQSIGRKATLTNHIVVCPQSKTVKEIAVLHGVKEETIRTHRRKLATIK